MLKRTLWGIVEFSCYVALTGVLLVFVLAYFDVLCYNGGMSCLNPF